MARDYSKYLPTKSKNQSSKRTLSTLDVLGWQPHFSSQISAEELPLTRPVRVIEVHREGFETKGEGINITLPPDVDVTVGDWLLIDPNNPAANRLLDRKSLIKRRAAGTERKIQLIAANIDTAFIVSSCNQDFNVARLERYIALAFEADVAPVIVLTKLDLCDSPDHYIRDASAISAAVPVIALDARGEDPVSMLVDWCKPGQTVAFIGSSGVGKSTLTNALCGTQAIETGAIKTQAIREGIGKGRHTTTRRQLYIVPGGCAVLDTPGMRELQVTDIDAGVAAVFSDLQSLSTQCKFNDCKHVSEPGCAVLAAVESGTVDEARVQRWNKLSAENQFNTASLAQRKTKDKSLSKNIRQMKRLKKK